MDAEQREYRVSWVIDIVATDPVDAARKAHEIQQDADNIANMFEVRMHGSDVVFPVDLEDLEP